VLFFILKDVVLVFNHDDVVFDHDNDVVDGLD